jgi:hypothetical protein
MPGVVYNQSIPYEHPAVPRPVSLIRMLDTNGFIPDCGPGTVPLFDDTLYFRLPVDNRTDALDYAAWLVPGVITAYFYIGNRVGAALTTPVAAVAVNSQLGVFSIQVPKWHVNMQLVFDQSLPTLEINDIEFFTNPLPISA